MMSESLVVPDTVQRRTERNGVCPGKFTICIVRGEDWVILGYVTYHSEVLNESHEKACFSSLTTEGFYSDELCHRIYAALS